MVVLLFGLRVIMWNAVILLFVPERGGQCIREFIQRVLIFMRQDSLYLFKAIVKFFHLYLEQYILLQAIHWQILFARKRKLFHYIWLPAIQE